MNNRVLANRKSLNENGDIEAFANEKSEKVIEKFLQIKKVILSEYPNGVLFSPMSNRLLEDKVGILLDETMLTVLRKQMFRRLDDVCLFPEMVASEEIQYQIVNMAMMWLEEFACFSMSALKQQVAFDVHNLSNDNKEFENFLLFLTEGRTNTLQIKPRTWNGIRIARAQSANFQTAIARLGHKIEVILDEAGGTVTEAELLTKIPALDNALLSAVVNNFSSNVLKTEINGLICFTHIESLGLPDDFSTQLSKSILQLETLNIDVSETALHTALSLSYEVNFNNVYQISDKKTFRNIVAQYFKGEKPHVWSSGFFLEVRG